MIGHEGKVRSQLDNFVKDVPKLCIKMIGMTYFFHECEIWYLQEESAILALLFQRQLVLKKNTIFDFFLILLALIIRLLI